MTTFTIQKIIKQTADLLSDSPTARLDAEILLSHVLNVSREYLHAWPEKKITEKQLTRFKELIEKRKTGYPIAYLIGEKEFWSLTFNVSLDVLIPRPETELLVETVLETFPAKEKISFLELGTGSGAIALSIAHERPNWEIVATDISEKAIEIAKNNAKRLNIKNVDFILSHWFDALAEKKFHIIVSNPPYIAENDPHLREEEIRFEPKQALVSGKDGLDAIRIIINQSKNYLMPDGYLLLEHGFDQGAVVRKLFQNNGYHHVQTLQDISGYDRVTVGAYNIL